MLKVSVIIPTLDELHTIESCLSHLEELEGVWEVIVADGGSSDGTDTAASQRARLVRSPRGRAVQMNQGAAHAGGDILLFLHADTRLPQTAIEAIQAALEEPRVVGGMFGKVPFHEHPLLTLSDYFVDWVQSRCVALLGDRAVFVRKDAFEAIGGYRPLEIMEDPDLGHRLQKLGRLTILKERVTTSARRFLQAGVVKTLHLMFWLCLLYQLGVPTEWLARFYRKVR